MWEESEGGLLVRKFIWRKALSHGETRMSLLGELLRTDWDGRGHCPSKSLHILNNIYVIHAREYMWIG